MKMIVLFLMFFIAFPTIGRAVEQTIGNKLAPPGNYAYIGQFILGDEDLDAFILKTGSTPAIVYFMCDWIRDQDWLANPKGPIPIELIDEETMSALRTVADRGIIPAIGWGIAPLVYWDIPPENVRYMPNIPRILSGEFDKYIAATARQLKEYGDPILMTPLVEIDNYSEYSFGKTGLESSESFDAKNLVDQYGNPDWPDGPERVHDMFIHIIDIFRREGADNVSWFMYANTEFQEPGTEGSVWWNHPKYYYPGDEYIDWVGKSMLFKNTEDFKDKFEAAYDAWGEVTKRPFIIPEFNMLEDRKSRSEIIREIFSDYLPTKPRLKLVFFHDTLIKVDWVVPLTGWKGEFPDEILAWEEAVVNNPYYRKRVIIQK